MKKIIKNKFKLFIPLLQFSFLVSQSNNLDDDLIQKLKNAGISTEDMKELAVPGMNLPEVNDVKNNSAFQNDNVIKQEIETVIESDASQNSFKEADIETIKKQDANNKESNLLIDDSTLKLVRQKNSENIKEKYVEVEQIQTKMDTYFGYNVFEGNPEMFQGSNFESISPDYIIGPGDEIIIMLWGETEINSRYTITRDGYVFIPNLGQVFVNSLSLSGLEKKLFKLLKKAYSSLDPPSGMPTTFFSVSLGSVALKPIRIFVLGDVDQPGAYLVKPSASLFSSLFYFNGPKTSGSLREIKLIRNEKEFATVDYYDYLTTGKMKGDVRLQRDDVIFIPPRKNTVKLFGSINNSKIYEFIDGEDLLHVINFAGGLRSTTFLKRAQVKRILPPKERSDHSGTRTVIDVDLRTILSKKKRFELRDGDVIEFYDIDNLTKDVVDINGSVVIRPGSYQLKNNMRVLDLIIAADSLKGDAFLDRAEIIRTNDDRTESIILIDLRRAINKDPEHNIVLKSRDILTVQENSEVRFKSDVAIMGHVKSPGDKPFYKGMTVYDLLIMGGGFDDASHAKNTFFQRADLIYFDFQGRQTKIVPFRLDSALSKKGISKKQLEMGNEIKIYTFQEIYGMPPNSVSIRGHVKNPGTYDIVENFNISDLLFLAGGFDDESHLRRLFSQRLDLHRINSDFISRDIITYDIADIFKGLNNSNFKIMPGDEIIIFSIDNFVKDKNIIIRGQITSPGFYKLKNKMTLKDLIIEAGGVNSEIDKFRVDVSRFNYKKGRNNFENYTDILKVEITNDLTLFDRSLVESKNNILLENNDIVTIRIHQKKTIIRNVTINGLVRFPGEYVISNSGEKITDIIDRAGGLIIGAYPIASEFYRDGKKIRLSFDKLIRNPRSRLNFIIQDGDLIDIKGVSNIVEVVGEVNNPGFYQYLKGARYNDYVNLAGGYTKNAIKYGSYVSHPDGSATKIGLIKRAPEVYDGSIVRILAKESTEPFNLTKYVSNLTSIYADLTQSYLLIMLALNS
jgi:protein involved in polysaccharide export with SLBB domain